MEIVRNAFVNRIGAYYESGGLIEGTQRIPINHQSYYWQQANFENTLSINSNNISNKIEIDEAIYIGRIPTHFGHFLMEGLPRLCDVVNIDKPIIGYITDGFLPDGIKPTPEKEIRWVIMTATKEYFYEINEDETYLVKILFVPKLPYHLSNSCSEPWRMVNLINKLVTTARNENDDITNIDFYHLTNYHDNVVSIVFKYSDPNESLSKQIAKISYADNLFGKIGSNTHLSLFAKWEAKTNWESRSSYKESDRNQLICDFVKTFNLH